MSGGQRGNQRLRLFSASSMLRPILAVLSVLIVGTRGQVGELCACQPSSYEFVLDFALDCNNTTFQSGPGTGIVPTPTCLTNGRDLPFETNLDFAFVELIQVFELDQVFDLVPNQTNLEGVFADGFRFTHTSALATMSDFNETTLPRAIQLNLLGNNTEGRRIQASWSLFFSNNCSVFPVIEPIQTSVITVVVSIHSFEHTFEFRTLNFFQFI